MSTDVMFDGFRLAHLEVGDVRLRVRYGGTGPPVLLVHGHPRTHTTWHRVAPALANAGFSVVCPDLRGYGESTTLRDQPDHAQASKRAMASDLAELMTLVILGGVPIGEALARCDSRFATAWWHWFFIGQPNGMAERLIAADVDGWYRLDAALMGDENYNDVAKAVSLPAVQHAMCEDYRAGLGVDRDADDEDRRAGLRIQQRLLVLWGANDDVAALYDGDILGVWRAWATSVEGYSINAGHHIAEEAPGALVQALTDFLTAA